MHNKKDGGLADEVFAVFRFALSSRSFYGRHMGRPEAAAEAGRRGSVLFCINGHFHRDHLTIQDQVCYMEINSASFEWVSNAHEHFPQELKDQYNLIDHTVIYNDLLYAVVTLEGNTITVQGTESTMFMGINREDTPNPPCDQCGRPVIPRVQSARISLD